MSYSQPALLIKDGNRVHRSRQDPGHNVKMWFLPKPPRGIPRALNRYYHGVVARGRNVVCVHRPSTRKGTFGLPRTDQLRDSEPIFGHGLLKSISSCKAATDHQLSPHRISVVMRFANHTLVKFTSRIIGCSVTKRGQIIRSDERPKDQMRSRCALSS